MIGVGASVDAPQHLPGPVAPGQGRSLCPIAHGGSLAATYSRLANPLAALLITKRANDNHHYPRGRCTITGSTLIDHTLACVSRTVYTSY